MELPRFEPIVMHESTLYFSRSSLSSIVGEKEVDYQTSYRPPIITLFISNSNYNLNWNRFAPTSKICNVSSNPHAHRRIFFVALLLNDLHVRNLPMRLRVQLSIASIHPASEISMTSISSNDSFIFFNP